MGASTVVRRTSLLTLQHWQKKNSSDTLHSSDKKFKKLSQHFLLMLDIDHANLFFFFDDPSSSFFVSTETCGNGSSLKTGHIFKSFSSIYVYTEKVTYETKDDDPIGAF